MATPLLPHGLSGALARLAASAEATPTLVVKRLGAICEDAAKRNIRAGGAHKAGTTTTARKGGGPAVITGALSRAVTHEMVGDTTVRVGAADTPHPPEKPRWKAPKATSGQIGGYVERKGYPWLKPALEATVLAAGGEVGAVLRELPW
jgi:hypothetical protein